MPIKRIKVAVGVIERNGLFFVAKRPGHVHQGGLWEFPGGKVEPGEVVQQALARELHEELGIDVDQAAMSPLIKVSHDYEDKSVELDVWRVQNFLGEPHGKEGQLVKWVSTRDLKTLDFPAANVPIVRAVCLPETYLITGEYLKPAECIRKLEHVFLGHRPGAARLRGANRADYPALGQRFVDLCEANGVLPVLDWYEGVTTSKAAGVHFTAAQLAEIITVASGPLAGDFHRLGRLHKWRGVSCHSLDEVLQAQEIGADFVTLSPVKNTPTHPEVAGMGWPKFADIVAHVRVPVFALGGVSETDLATVREAGGAGVAGIGAWWPALSCADE
ncbi:MAG: Nudix family hydrolase [Hahellaceae bacterium]|nr:Nudix family hydrolase [Hahellaceae bacterium]MCP5210814.1 Nudix family hydrolase [Hahellaceae bacterium]